MLSPAPDGVTYNGLDPNLTGFGALTAAQQPNNFFGYAGTGGLNLPGRYIFDDKAKMPLMTYSSSSSSRRKRRTARATRRPRSRRTATASRRTSIS